MTDQPVFTNRQWTALVVTAAASGVALGWVLFRGAETVVRRLAR